MTRPTASRRRVTVVGAAVLAALAGAVLGGLGGVAGLTGAPDRASAHDFLESTVPAADEVVTGALDTVTLTFNSPPLADASAAIAIEVHDPSGGNIATGTVSIVDSTLSIAVAPVSTGAHQVLWQTVSSDGHPVSGEFAFDYEGPITAPTPEATVAPTADSTATPAPAVATATPEAPEPVVTAAAADASGTASGGGVTPLVWVGLGSAVAVLAVVGLVAVLAGRRRAAPAAPAAPGEERLPGD